MRRATVSATEPARGPRVAPRTASRDRRGAGARRAHGGALMARGQPAGDQRPQRVPGAGRRHRVEHVPDAAFGRRGGPARPDPGKPWTRCSRRRPTARSWARAATAGSSSRRSSGGSPRGWRSAPASTRAAIAGALGEASAVAYRAVMKPTEGTILTVVRDAAAAAAVGSRGVRRRPDRPRPARRRGPRRGRANHRPAPGAP